MSHLQHYSFWGFLHPGLPETALSVPPTSNQFSTGLAAGQDGVAGDCRP